MTLSKAILPTDPDKLREFAILLQAELYNKTLHIEKLKAQLAHLSPGALWPLLGKARSRHRTA